MALEYYQAFREPSPYEQERLKAERLRRYAELLEQQGGEPEGEFTYQGIRAMPSPAAALGKMLQAYQSKKAREKAEEAERKQTGMEEEAAGQIAGRLMGKPIIPEEGLQEFQSAAPAFAQGVQQRIAEEQAQRESGDIQEITRQSQYRYDPEGAMQRAMTPQGLGAVKGNPLLAAALQRSMEIPAAEKFYAPTETEEGLVQYGERGGVKKSPYRAAAKPASPTELSRLIAERDALPKGSPQIATYDAAIRKQTTTAPPFNIDLGAKGDVEAQKVFIQDLGAMRPRAQAAANIIKSVNNLDRLTEKGTFVGSLAPTAVGASQFLSGLGFKIAPDVLSNTEQFQAAVSDLILSTQASLGGARGFTREETEILNRMFPQIVNSPQARVAIGNIIRNKQLDVIDEYDSLIDDYKSTFKDSRIPYKKIDDEEVRYQRWKRSQGGL